MRTLMHRFRFQLLHQWLITTYPPCKAADIGGGKGLLAYLLNQSGWVTTVIDPNVSPVEHKYKDLALDKQVRLTPAQMASVPHLAKPFSPELAAGFDLLIGLHAHGSNMYILQAAAKYHIDFVILPCCVIDEPLDKRTGVNWFKSLNDYAHELGLHPQTTTLPFKGQNKLLYSHH